MSIRQRMYPSASAKKVHHKHCSDSRFVKNAALEQAKQYDPRKGPTPGPAERQRQLAQARQALPWLRDGSSSVQQQALREFDQAMRNFFNGTHAFPTWWKKGINEGFVIRDLRVKRFDSEWAAAHVPKAGWVRFRLTRPFTEIQAATSARVTLDRAGRWHISFVCPPPILDREPTGAVIGLDLGTVHTLTTSDGEHNHGPGRSSGEEQRLRRLKRKQARQRKGSNRRDETKRSIARLHAREADRRKDWIEQVTTRLVIDNDLIALEDLKVKNMLRSASGTVEQPGVNVAQKRGLNRSISQQAWSLFRRRLKDKARTCGVTVVAVNVAGTSQTCHHCKHRDARSRKNQAAFHCVNCGHRDNADINAAKNILAAGLAVTGRGGTPRSQGSGEASTLARAA